MNLLNELSKFKNVTTTQKNAIVSPQTGLVVFDVTLAKLQVYNGTTWGDLGGGGSGGVTIYECTVGVTGADYTTLGAAITAGKTRILVIANTTETADIILNNTLNYSISGINKNININMGNFEINNGGNSNYFNLENIKITSTNDYFLRSIYNIYINDVYFNLSGRGSQTVSFINPLSYSKIENCSFICSNFRCTIVNIGLCVVNNCSITGGGTGTSYVFASSFSYGLNNIYFNGTFTNNINTPIVYLGNAQNIYFNITSSGYINLSKNIYNINAININIQILYSLLYSSIYGVQCNNLIFEGTGVLNVELGGFYINGIFTMNASHCKINNSTIQGGILITGSNNTVNGCKVGGDAGGGTNTITINAGAINTIVTGTRTDAAIVDNGTTSILNSNVVY